MLIYIANDELDLPCNTLAFSRVHITAAAKAKEHWARCARLQRWETVTPYDKQITCLVYFCYPDILDIPIYEIPEGFEWLEGSHASLIEGIILALDKVSEQIHEGKIC